MSKKSEFIHFVLSSIVSIVGFGVVVSHAVNYFFLSSVMEKSNGTGYLIGSLFAGAAGLYMAIKAYRHYKRYSKLKLNLEFLDDPENTISEKDLLNVKTTPLVVEITHEDIQRELDFILSSFKEKFSTYREMGSTGYEALSKDFSVRYMEHVEKFYSALDAKTKDNMLWTVTNTLLNEYRLGESALTQEEILDCVHLCEAKNVRAVCVGQDIGLTIKKDTSVEKKPRSFKGIEVLKEASELIDKTRVEDAPGTRPLLDTNVEEVTQEVTPDMVAYLALEKEIYRVTFAIYQDNTLDINEAIAEQSKKVDALVKEYVEKNYPDLNDSDKDDFIFTLGFKYKQEFAAKFEKPEEEIPSPAEVRTMAKEAEAQTELNETREHEPNPLGPKLPNHGVSGYHVSIDTPLHPSAKRQRDAKGRFIKVNSGPNRAERRASKKKK